MEENQHSINRKVRPGLLTFLCTLTFIGSGMASFVFMMVYLSYDEMLIAMDDFKGQFPELVNIFRGGRQFFIASSILYFISLMGAIQMWKLKKIGFHIYTAAQIFVLILPMALIDSSMISVFEIFITLAFVSGYFSQIKHMS
ncbi:MAG: hypothetical protein KQI35_05410 [Bacteroidetes bacterium]|nr:hypothetical protein [Bacteroidota bacterium]